jgi:hypothetical protein
MSLEIEDKEKMLVTCQEILERCEKPFVWEDDDTYQYGNFKKPFNLVFPHPQIDQELQNILKTFSDSIYLYDQIKATCTLNEEWFETGTYGLDRDFTRYFSKYTLKPHYAEQIKIYFQKRLGELEQNA